MRKFLVTIYALFFSIKIFAFDQKILNYLDSLYENKKFNGIVYVKYGDQEFEKSYGYANQNNEVLTNLHQFKIGSLTKQFTAYVIFDLIKKGRLQENDDVNKFFPEVEKKFFEKNKVQLKISHLLTHSSGLFDYKMFSIEWSKQKNIEYFEFFYPFIPLDFVPGTRYRYTNYNYFLLGEIIHRLTNKYYFEYLNSSVKSDIFNLKPVFDNSSPIASGLIKIGTKLFEAKKVYPNLLSHDYDWFNSSDGGLVVSLENLKKWNIFLFNQYKQDKFFQSRLPREKNEYNLGFINIGSAEDPVFFHNGALSPLGFKSESIWDTAGNMIVILGNFDANIPLAVDLIQFFHSDKNELKINSKESYKPKLNYLLDYLKLLPIDIILPMLYILALIRRKNISGFYFHSYLALTLLVFFNLYSIINLKLQFLSLFAAFIITWMIVLRKTNYENLNFRIGGSRIFYFLALLTCLILNVISICALLSVWVG